MKSIMNQDEINALVREMDESITDLETLSDQTQYYSKYNRKSILVPNFPTLVVRKHDNKHGYLIADGYYILTELQAIKDYTHYYVTPFFNKFIVTFCINPKYDYYPCSYPVSQGIGWSREDEYR